MLEYFILEVTARSAANLLGIQANSAILFYRKVRQEIAEKLTIELALYSVWYNTAHLNVLYCYIKNTISMNPAVQY